MARRKYRDRNTPAWKLAAKSDRYSRRLRLTRPKGSTKLMPWREWCAKFFPEITSYAFSESHIAAWEWALEITPTHTPEDLVIIVARGGAKTTTNDLIVAYLLAHKLRDFVLIVSANMPKANDRVRSIQALLTSEKFRKAYPDVGEPGLGTEGQSLGWTNSLLVTEARQVVKAASLGSDNRGYNHEGRRPGVIILDDIDKTFDSDAFTRKKERAIASDILPTEGNTSPAAVMLTQNLIRNGGVVDRIRTGESDLFSRRRLIGPIPAIRDLEYITHDRERIEDDGTTVPYREIEITGGTATWEGQDLVSCQSKMNRFGISTFLHEQQHQVIDLEGALLKMEHFIVVPMPSRDHFVEAVVGVDPSGGSTQVGIVAVGIRSDGSVCVLEDRTQYMGTEGEWAKVSVLLAYKYEADIVMESNYGGQLGIDTLLVASRELIRVGLVPCLPTIYPVPAVMSKRARAWPVAQRYIQGNVHHAGEFTKLKAEWTTWVQDKTKESPNRMDAEVHAINHATMDIVRRPAPCNVDM